VPIKAFESRVVRLHHCQTVSARIAAAYALRDDALQAQLAGVGEHDAPSATKTSLNRTLSTPATRGKSGSPLPRLELTKNLPMSWRGWIIGEESRRHGCAGLRNCWSHDKAQQVEKRAAVAGASSADPLPSVAPKQSSLMAGRNLPPRMNSQIRQARALAPRL
jgi:hypothetical protein